MLSSKLAALLAILPAAAAFHGSLPSIRTPARHDAGICMSAEPSGRRAALSLLGGAALGGFVTTGNDEAWALVKGLAPPENYGKGREGASKPTNIQEARERGAKREAELFDKDSGEFQKTPSGDRYRDIVVGTGAEVKTGSEADIKYRVLRLGKRSRDGLSGEASLVFSYGYGEDDDKETDVKTVKVGETGLIKALEESILGIKEGGKRRISVIPERGWRITDKACAGAIDVGSALGLPGASVTEAEGCLDNVRVPSPTTFQAKRKLGRRFDESLLLEVEVVKVK